MSNTVQFTINLDGNAYTGIVQLDEALNGLNVQAKVTHVGTANYKKSTLRKKVLANPNDPAIADEFGRWKYAASMCVCF